MPAALDSSDQNPPPSEPGGLKSGALRGLGAAAGSVGREGGPGRATRPGSPSQQAP